LLDAGVPLTASVAGVAMGVLLDDVDDPVVLPCVDIKFTARSRPPRHRRDAGSMAWRCRFLTARRSQRSHVIAEK
jgi:hypothetical protein